MISEFVQVLTILCVFLGFLVGVFALFCYRPDKFSFGSKKKTTNKEENEISITLDANAKKDN